MHPNNVSREQTLPARYHWFLAALGLFALVVAIWLPTGFNVSGWGDEWHHMALMDASPFAIALDIRPLIQLSWWVSHLLTPNSFLGMNLLLILALFGKGLGLYALLTRLKTDMRVVAFAAAALFVVYPSDSASLTLAVLNIHLSAAFFLLAASSFVIYWQKPSIIAVMGIGLGLLLALGIVEISLPLVIFFPLILLILEKRFHRRMLWAALIWYIVPAIYLLRALILSLQGYNVLGYQATKMAGENNVVVLTGSILNTYVWHFLSSWLNAIGFTLSQPVLLLSVASILIAGLLLELSLRRTTGIGLLHGYSGLALVGLIALGLGFMPFILASFRDSHVRTTLYSSGGAAIVLAILIIAIARLQWQIRSFLAVGLIIVFGVFYRLQPFPLFFTGLFISLIIISLILPRFEWRYAALVTAFLGVGLHYLIDQHTHFQKAAQLQEVTLKQIVSAAPQVKADATILLVGEQSAPVFEHFLYSSEHFQAALQYLYSNINQPAYLCSIGSDSISNPALATCQFQNSGINVIYSSQPFSLGYDKVIVFEYTEDAKVKLLSTLPPEIVINNENPDNYSPLQLIVPGAPLPEKLKTVFDN